MKIDDEFKHRGLTLVGHELRLVPDKKPTAAIPQRNRENIAACAVHGLSYWSDAPQQNTVWAADFNGEFHIVEINRKAGTSYWKGDKAAYQTPANVQQVAVLLGGEWVNEVEIPKPTAGERRYSKARNEAKKAKRDAEMDAHYAKALEEARANAAGPSRGEVMAVLMISRDPSAITNLHTDYLTAALGHTDFDDQINAELQRRAS